MCLVSVIPLDDHWVISSNRDESIHRGPAFLEKSVLHAKRIEFPRDTAGGTWIAADEDGHCVVLLNGGFVAHKRKLPYRKSRGLIVLDLMAADHIVEAWYQMNLDNIEPFTLVYFSADKELFSWVWDGENKHGKALDSSEINIWMSSTLYDPKDLEENRQRFNNRLDPVSMEAILHCHQEGEYKHVKHRPKVEVVETVSRTQIIVGKNGLRSFDYTPLVDPLI